MIRVNNTMISNGVNGSPVHLHQIDHTIVTTPVNFDDCYPNGVDFDGQKFRSLELVIDDKSLYIAGEYYPLNARFSVTPDEAAHMTWALHGHALNVAHFGDHIYAIA